MRLAIPEFNGRVSPVFDCCRKLLVIDTSPDGPTRIVAMDWSGLLQDQRPGRLRELGIGTLLCGGISRDLADKIEVRGVEVVPWVSGEISQILNAYLNGRLPDPRLSMPGCCGIRAHRTGRCRNRTVQKQERDDRGRNYLNRWR